MFNMFYNELQTNQACVFLNVSLSILCVSPDDGVTLHQNMSRVL